MKTYIRWFENIGIQNIAIVGGKNASLGEMVQTLKPKGIDVPDGFATTAEAYWDFLRENRAKDEIRSLLGKIKNENKSLRKMGQAVREIILGSTFSDEMIGQIQQAYRELGQRYHMKDVDVAVRSSATAEDLPDASFAGQQETFLNVRGESAVLAACQRCFASLFTDRAIAYRREKKFDHMKVALSIGIQKMVRSDRAGSGVMFSIDTESGFPNAVVINAAWGLGETVVQGTVDPDEIMIFKPLLAARQTTPIVEKKRGRKEQKMIITANVNQPTKTVRTSAVERSSFVLTDAETLTLARWAVLIESHYGRPMDIEWAKDGESRRLFIVQARPETVQSQRQRKTFTSYELVEKGRKIIEGLAIGDAIAIGPVQIIRHASDLTKFRSGSILVTTTTDPDWVPVMKKAAGIVTDHGGRTSHAAIVSRELGIPAIVGTGRATELLRDNTAITLSCAEGETGFVYDGRLAFRQNEVDLETLGKPSIPIMMNIASPEAALRWWRLPTSGIGLARMEFIISDVIKIHPMATLHFDRVRDRAERKQIEDLTHGYKPKKEYFVDVLARGIAKIAASQYPHPVIVRMSDFKTNEYANLLGGRSFEPIEANPMIGFRGASRYYNEKYREGFALECEAILRAREQMGFSNIIVMIPFCRTLTEADKVLSEMSTHGLRRGRNGLQVYVMCEIPSNVILADQFADRFDGFSIGSNDLTQLVLGVDRDSEDLAEIFDERNEAVKIMIRNVIETAHRKRCEVGICGQAPSDHPEFAEFLVRSGIDSISLNPDSVVSVIQRLARHASTNNAQQEVPL